MASPTESKPITSTTIPGTKVPDVTQADAQDAAGKWFMSKVAITTAILATLASLASMFSGSNLNQAMLKQIECSNQWNFFQAKGIKLAVLESRVAMLKQLAPNAPIPAEDTADLARYAEEQTQIKADAQTADTAARDHHRRHTTLGKSSTAYQVAIALAAVALLAKRSSLWYASIVLGVVGSVFFALGMM